MRPRNHFVEALGEETGGWVQGDADFGPWLDRYETWFRNGRYDKTANVAVTDPFEFYESGGRTRWCRKGSWDAWAAQNIYIRRLAVGDERETSRFED